MDSELPTDDSSGAAYLPVEYNLEEIVPGEWNVEARGRTVIRERIIVEDALDGVMERTESWFAPHYRDTYYLRGQRST